VSSCTCVRTAQLSEVEGYDGAEDLVSAPKGSLFAARRPLEGVNKTRSGEPLAFPLGRPPGLHCDVHGRQHLRGCGLPFQVHAWNRGLFVDPGAPADPSPFQQASSGASVRSRTSSLLHVGAEQAAPQWACDKGSECSGAAEGAALCNAGALDARRGG
jgi:hypothetical protein